MHSATPCVQTEDDVLFWALSEKVPRRENALPLSLEDQIEWTVNKTKAYKNQALDTYRAESKPGTEEPATLASIVDGVVESRRA